MEMEGKDILYGLGLFLTFCLGVWNLLSSQGLNKKTSFINTVTSQRIKWIEQLRQDISSYAGLTYTWSASNMEGKPQEYEIVKEIDRLRHVIKLRLNPSGMQDKKIDALLNEIPKYTDPSQFGKLKTCIDALVVASQELLKEEWEKVKREAEQGNLHKS